MTWKRRAVLAGLLVGMVAGLLGLAAASGPAAAQDVNRSNITNESDYYANESISVDNESWFEGIDNATLPNLGRMATRFGPFFIGTGEMDPSGTGFMGVLITGIVMVGALMGSVALLPIGAPGGAVLAIATGYGMTELGLAPSWFRVLLLFGVGVVVFVAILRAGEGR